MTPSRFPHSDIPGSKSACDSPRLIAACHVLHRLLVPRHPPHALTSLAKKFAPDRQHPVQPSQNLAIKRAQYKCSAKKLLDYSVVKEPAGVRQRRVEPAVDTQRVSLAIDFWFNPRTFFRETFCPKTSDLTELLHRSGGEYRARTGDLRLAKPALSQLS